MKLSLFSFIYFLNLLLSPAAPTELNDLDSCPTSRRLLLFGGFHFPLGEKKSEQIPSTLKSSSSSKSGRTDEGHGPIVYIRPQTSSELGHKVRSYSHLLKSKLYSQEERAKLKKKRHIEKKKALVKKSPKKKNITASKPSGIAKTRDLVAINDEDRDRCRAILQIDRENSLIPVQEIKKKTNKDSKKKPPIPVQQPPVVVKEKRKPKKNKAVSIPTEKIKVNEKKQSPLTPPIENGQSKPNSTPPPPPQSTSNSKGKRDNPPIIDEPINEFEVDEKNNSVVGRAYYFVKNMFQLSDDLFEGNQTHNEDTIILTTNEHQHRQTRKLLSLNQYGNELVEPVPSSSDLLFSASRVVKRQLLSVKTNKRTASVKSNEKRVNLVENKPKVGWVYRYRISRYLADQKVKRTGGGKSKTSSSNNAIISKRKLLEFDRENELFDQRIVNSVSITQTFLPKRQLLAVDLVSEESDDDDEKTQERRRMKSYQELTDPTAIVQSYDRGLFKPRVGWQFRYRVSRYIDSLRANIREDQERLNLGLLAIKRKTPQELSGRRKRVLDKPFTPELEPVEPIVQDNKPNVGWRYRYRISKMLDAKQRGEYIDDEEEKRRARLGTKKNIEGGLDKTGDDEDCLEWEHDLDSELRKITDEGRRVGWAYRYRIRRKLDDLKQRQTETGIPFDLETLGGGGGKREKKPAVSPTDTDEVKPIESTKKLVGWQYRYRVSKMLEAQKREAEELLTKSTSKKADELPIDARLDPELAQLTPEQRIVGWAYRYRIRRKLDSIKAAARESDGGKRSRGSSKRKHKEEIIKQVEESIEKILNIDDIDETPFMEYFRRTSTYIFLGLVPTARKSICLLPLPVVLAFCNEETSEPIVKTTTEPTVIKKERIKKDKRIQLTRPTKSEQSNKPASSTNDKPRKKIQQERIRPPNRRHHNEQIKHFDEEEQPIKKRIGVESTKRKNKKQFQIIGQQVKIKHKHSTTTNPPPVLTTTPLPPPVVTTSAPPIVEVPPAPVEPEIIASSIPSTLSEVIQDEEEASTLLSSSTSIFLDEANEEISENLSPPTTTPVAVIDDAGDTASDDDDDDSSSSSDSNSNESDTDTDNEQTREKFDPLALKKMKQIYENAKERVHGVFDLKDEKDSS